MGDKSNWTESVVGSTTADEINHSMGDRRSDFNYHDDGKGFSATDEKGNRHSYRDSDNAKGHDHWVNGSKTSK
jgi:hypothetical protein